MDKLKIRKASYKDKDTLLVFEQGVIDAERPFDPTLKRESTRYYDLDLMIDSALVELLVAEFDGEPVGCGYARIETSKPYLKHKQHAYLGFMYVVPSFRGKGINKAIITALQSWIRKNGITEMRLEVYHHNQSAIKAYEKVGFVQHMIEMRKGLEDAD